MGYQFFKDPETGEIKIKAREGKSYQCPGTTVWYPNNWNMPWRRAKWLIAEKAAAELA
jgi:hypothetical protein